MSKADYEQIKRAVKEGVAEGLEEFLRKHPELSQPAQQNTTLRGIPVSGCGAPGSIRTPESNNPYFSTTWARDENPIF